MKCLIHLTVKLIKANTYAHHHGPSVHGFIRASLLKVASCRPGSSLHSSSSAAAGGGIGVSEVPAAVGAPPGHSAYTSVRGASSVTSGTDGRPNCSVRSSDAGGDGTAVICSTPGAGGAGAATAGWLTFSRYRCRNSDMGCT